VHADAINFGAVALVGKQAASCVGANGDGAEYFFARTGDKCRGAWTRYWSCGLLDWYM